MEQQVLSISQINEYIRELMDRDRLLSGVAVRGEISNYKLYPSGHHYFTMKDDNSALRCVMFKGNATKLRFRPANGMKVVVIGKISVYPRDGTYQLYCSSMIIDGVGDLNAAFEQLKSKLASQGLFDAAHKKPIPKYPGTIGIITSSAGAAIHDMLRIIHKRYPLTKVKLLPVRVQGVEAPGEICAAICYANRYKLADVLIIGRGGGSIEDLWAFNDENVAHAVYQSEIPVISAVGHEPDVTISDYVADLRAATPSNAAELVVPDQDVLRQNLDSMNIVLATAMQRQINNAKQHLKVLSKSQILRSPYGYLNIKRNGLEQNARRLTSGYENQLLKKHHRYVSCVAKLDAMSPLKVLSRGYSMVQTKNGSVVRSAAQVECGQEICISLSEGSLLATVTDKKENLR